MNPENMLSKKASHKRPHIDITGFHLFDRSRIVRKSDSWLSSPESDLIGLVGVKRGGWRVIDNGYWIFRGQKCSKLDCVDYYIILLTY